MNNTMMIHPSLFENAIITFGDINLHKKEKKEQFNIAD